MRNPSRFLALPNELIHTVAGHTESRDLFSLCQTNRQIHNICLEWIYRSITVNDPARLVQCCKTIVSRTEAADLVRKLTISCYPRRPLKSYYSTVGSAIRKLKNLQSLEVPPSLTYTFFQLFSATQFPHLSECVLPASVEIIPFLERHPMISRLSAMPYNVAPSTSNLIQIDEDTLFGSLQPIRMPKLQEFLGPAPLAYIVIPGSSTSRMSIYWESNRSTSSSDGVATLARSAVDVLLIQNLVVGWDRQLLSAIAAHMPRLERLMFRNLGNCEDEKLFLSHIDDTLGSLPHLRSIILLAGFTADPHHRNAHEEFEAVRRWGEIAPMLTDVTFPSNTTWTYLPLPLGLWLPGIDGARFKLEDLNVKSFYTAVLTSLVALPSAYHAMAEHLAGPDALLIVKNAIDSGEAIPDFVPTQNPLRLFRLYLRRARDMQGKETCTVETKRIGGVSLERLVDQARRTEYTAWEHHAIVCRAYMEAASGRPRSSQCWWVSDPKRPVTFDEMEQMLQQDEDATDLPSLPGGDTGISVKIVDLFDFAKQEWGRSHIETARQSLAEEAELSELADRGTAVLDDGRSVGLDPVAEAVLRGF
ncbi:hypothetical protein C8R44DRAFT_854916 [Mycena epipterygia]|nr:hypothetical protein C8R44DRAFT_854916 [Mycena epipterygia]